MNSKKIICMALAVATVVPMMFAGCNSNTATSSSNNSSAPKETVTLKVFTGDKTIQGLDRVTEEVNKYLKSKNTGIAIKWETMGWDDLGTKQQTMLSTGQEADVMNSSSWLKGSAYVANARNNYYTDITKYVTDAKNKDLIDILSQSFLDGTKVNGKYYGLPTNKEQAHNFGLLVQKNEAEKLGIDLKSIKSLDDMEKYFDKVKADGLTPICAAKMDHPFKLLDWDVADGDGMIGAFDPADEKKVVNQFTDQKTVDFFKKMKDYNTKGYFAKTAVTANSQEDEMKSNKYFCGCWSLMPGKCDTESASLKLDLKQIDITPVEKSNRETLGALCIIPKTSKHPDQAFQFIKMLYTDKDLINMVTFGVKDKDYKQNSDGTISLVKDSDFQSAGGWIWGNEFNNYLMDNQSKTLFKDIEAYNKGSKVLDSLGFMFDNSKVQTEYASVNNVVQKYYPQLFYGTCPNVDETMTNFKKDLEQAGSEKVLKEMQTQYDAFLASKKK